MTKSIVIKNSNITFTNSEDSDLNLFGLVIDNTYMQLPTGNTLQRPTVPQIGMIRFNTETSKAEGYNGNVWTTLTI